jgi:hypothetical protein
LKAVLLFIELKRNLEFSEHDVSYLMRKLPAGCQKVMHGVRSLGFVMPAHDILPRMRAPLWKALEPFENYWLLGTSGEVLAKNGSMDPLASALRQYSVPPIRRREPSKS